MEIEDYSNAATVCEAAFVADADAGAGASAARADYFLGNQERVLAWEQRLRGSETEADVLSLTAYLRYQRGEVDLAEQAYERQLALYSEAGRHRQAAKSTHQLFQVYWETSRYAEALRASEAVYRAALAAEDAEWQAKAFEALLSTLLEIGDLDGAERARRRSLEAAGPELKSLRARLKVYEGLIQVNRGRPHLALAAHHEALALIGERPNRAFRRSTHLNIVKAALLTGDLDTASQNLAAAWGQADPELAAQAGLHFFQAEVESAQGRHRAAVDTLEKALEQKPVPDWAWEMEERLGIAHRALGHREEAAAAFARSIAVLESMRADLAISDLKVWHLEKRRRPYEALFRLRAESGQNVAALRVLEQAKARAFLDAFIAGTSTDPPVVTEPWKSAPASIERIETLRSVLPRMISSAVTAPVPVTELLAALGPRHVMLYFEAEEEIWLAVVSEGDVTLTRLPASRDRIAELVRALAARPDDSGGRRELSRLLLPPGALPPSGRTLYLVTDGQLGELAFAALEYERRYLAEQFGITHVPSLTALAAMAASRLGASGKPVVLGDPAGDLPGALDEARAVARSLGVTPHTGAEATLAALGEAARARLLHIAAHTGLGATGPWLRLADGELDAASLIEKEIRPRLVMLASCSAAARRGNDIWGSLAASFLVAGSESVVAALWSVQDREAHQFVLRFYEEGVTSDSVNALVRVQRSYIEAGVEPAVWAPFVHFGLEDVFIYPKEAL